jgi:hypothetical protein
MIVQTSPRKIAAASSILTFRANARPFIATERRFKAITLTGHGLGTEVRYRDECRTLDITGQAPDVTYKPSPEYIWASLLAMSQVVARAR